MLVKKILDNGGDIVPIIISQNEHGGVMNPSIYNDNGKLLCNIRHVNYTIYYSSNYPHLPQPTYLIKFQLKVIRYPLLFLLVRLGIYLLSN